MSIIINADDFALSENINNTIVMLHKQGIVTSTTIIATGNNFKEAVEISRDNPKLGIGVHLCLDGNFNVGNGYDSILVRNTNHFYDSDKIIKKLKIFSVDKSEIYKEYCLQIEKVLDHGISISHLDHHHHLHIYLPVLNCMINAARKYKIPYIRSQRLFLHEYKSRLNYLYRCTHQIYLKSRIHAADGYFKPSIIDNLHFEDNFNRLSELLKIKNKIIEIMLHPLDKDDPETLFYSSKKVCDLLFNQNLINYHDIV